MENEQRYNLERRLHLSRERAELVVKPYLVTCHFACTRAAARKLVKMSVYLRCFTIIVKLGSMSIGGLMSPQELALTPSSTLERPIENVHSEYKMK